jgi:hypothetical protein
VKADDKPLKQVIEIALEEEIATTSREQFRYRNVNQGRTKRVNDTYHLQNVRGELGGARTSSGQLKGTRSECYCNGFLLPLSEAWSYSKGLQKQVLSRCVQYAWE